MDGLLRTTLKLSKFLNVVAGIALSFMIFITVLDVMLRYFRMAIAGTYELVFFAGAVVVGFSLPLTQWARGHIQVDFLIQGLSPTAKKFVNVATRSLGICFFCLGGWYLIQMGLSLREAGEVSLTLKMPFYPIAYGLGFCFFVQCLVLLCDIVKILRGEYE